MSLKSCGELSEARGSSSVSVCCAVPMIHAYMARYDLDRFGVIPRFGRTEDVRWFEAKPCWVMHITNCYEDGDWVYVKGINQAIADGVEDISAQVITASGEIRDIQLKCAGLTPNERLILREGCLMYYYAAGYGKD